MRRSLPVLSALFAISTLSGCNHQTANPAAAGVSLTGKAVQGKVYGGQQPISGATIQLYAVSTNGTGTASTSLISTTVTTSDGSGNASNSNANAGNNYNQFSPGYFTITGDYTCASADTQVYLTAVGGNPGMGGTVNNSAISQMVLLGSCGALSSSTTLVVNELSTVAAVATMYSYMTAYNAVGTTAGNLPGLASEFAVATEYENYALGYAPGPTLPPGYYASTSELNTLADAIASCVNTDGTNTAGTPCYMLFQAATPPSGTAPTDTTGALLNILKYPTNNVASIFNLAPPGSPFQPTLSAAPADWTLPIVPLPVVSFSVDAGSYGSAQSVALSSSVSGATIYYTTDGSTPTRSSAVYSSPITVSAAETLKAFAVTSRVSGAVTSAAYTFVSTLPAPSISLPSGAYSTVQLVKLSSTVGGVSIYFTLDGTTPTTASPLYTTGVEITQTATLQAIAVAGALSSPVSSAAYTFSAPGIIQTIIGGGAAQTTLPSISAGFLPSGVCRDASGNVYTVQSAKVRKLDTLHGTLTDIAGTGVAGFSGDNGPATSAQVSGATSCAVDSTGNLYFSETVNNRIRKVSTSGVITTFAGSGATTYNAAMEGGSPTAAAFLAPYSVAVDASDNVYIADTNHYRIWKVDAATGKIATYAGNGAASYNPALSGGPATQVGLGTVRALAVDRQGNLLIGSFSLYRVFKVYAATGNIVSIAGTGTLGYSGENTPATTSNIAQVTGLAVDATGNVYFVSSAYGRILKLSASTGNLTTYAGDGGSSLADGVAATSSSLSTVSGISLTPNGDLYIAAQTQDRIRKVDVTTQIISTVAGNGTTSDTAVTTGPGVGVTTNFGAQIATDAAGNLYIAGNSDHRIYKWTASTGLVSIVAGTGVAGFSGDGGPATSAQLSAPYGVALDGSGNLYIADTNNIVIRKIDASTGTITTIAGIPGSAGVGYTDGPAASAQFRAVYGLAVSTDGTKVYVADSGNARIRLISGGTVSTFAGTTGNNGYYSSSEEGGPATSAYLGQPYGIALANDGTLYFSDAYNYRVFSVDTSQRIHTVAGTGANSDTGDGGPDTAAKVGSVYALALDKNGNLYLADPTDHVVRKITGSTISAVAGTGGTIGSSGDGQAATSALLRGPRGVAIDSNGNVFINDTGNIRIREIFAH